MSTRATNSAGFFTKPSSLLPDPPAGLRSARTVLLRERFLFFSVIAVACCVASWAGLLQGSAVTLLALAALAVAMWHGAYDQVQARQLFGGHRSQGLGRNLARHWLPVFLLGYAGLAALTLLGWWFFPFASLVLFLAYSAWHFGTEPEHRTPDPGAAVAAIALGAVPIVAACHWHAGAVTPIFAQMLQGIYTGTQMRQSTEMLSGIAVPAAHAATLTHALSMGCWPVLAIATLAILAGKFGRGMAQRGELMTVTVLQVALFGFCDPFLAFAVYFCCWHTPEHLITTSMPDSTPGNSSESLRSNLMHNLRVGFLPWLLSLAFLALVFYFGKHEAAAYQPEIFIVLSALTIPHMALNELRRAKQGRA